MQHAETGIYIERNSHMIEIYVLQTHKLKQARSHAHEVADLVKRGAQLYVAVDISEV